MKRQIKSLVEDLPSRRILAARKGIGSFFTIDVGEKHVLQSSDGTVRDVADLHLWVYLCDWELTKAGELVLSSASSEDEFPAALGSLVGQELEVLAVGASPRELMITVSGGHRLVLRENLEEYDAGDDMLLVYPHGKEAIGYCSELGFYENGSEE